VETIQSTPFGLSGAKLVKVFDIGYFRFRMPVSNAVTEIT